MVNLKPDEPVLRVVPAPSDVNVNGHIFGGWVLSQMDIGAGMLARRICRGPCATVAVDSMTFIAPIHVGDTVSVYAREVRRGNTSVAIGIEVFANRFSDDSDVKVTEGLFTFVAFDDNSRPRPIPKD